MRSNLLRKMVGLPVLALALTPLASASTALSRGPSSPELQSWSSEAEASNLLKEIKSLSTRLDTDAATLESFNRNRGLHWQTHADQLALAREHINEIGDRLERLQTIQSEVAPWQQRAIEEIVPVAANVAAHTESAIQHLNENRTYLFAPVYADHLSSIWEHAGDLKESVDAYLDYGDASDKVDHLQRKLDRLQERFGLSES